MGALAQAATSALVVFLVAALQPQAGTICDALRGGVEYRTVPGMGPDFSGAALEVFRVEGKPEVRYASRPASLEGAPEGTTIQHAYALDGDGSFELTVCFHSEAGPGFQAHSGPIRSSGGEHAVVSQVFVADAAVEYPFKSGESLRARLAQPDG